MVVIWLYYGSEMLLIRKKTLQVPKICELNPTYVFFSIYVIIP